MIFVQITFTTQDFRNDARSAEHVKILLVAQGDDRVNEGGAASGYCASSHGDN